LPRQSDSARRSGTKAAAAAGNESLISPHLRWTISDGRSHTPYRVNRPSKISGTRASAALWHIRANHAKNQATGQNQTKIKPDQTKKVTIGLFPLVASKRRRINHQTVIAVNCRQLPLIASHCQPLPAFPRKQIPGLLPFKNPQIIGQICEKHPQKNTLKSLHILAVKRGRY